MTGSHTFVRERNTEADTWAEKGVRGRSEEWEDDSIDVWPEVIGAHFVVNIPDQCRSRIPLTLKSLVALC